MQPSPLQADGGSGADCRCRVETLELQLSAQCFASHRAALMGCFFLKTQQFARALPRLTLQTLAWIVLLTPSVVHAQCPSLTDAGKPAVAEPQFYDEPQFTVAGVTDPTNLGGHGSDTVVRTKENLAKDAAALGRNATPASPPANAESRAAYELARSYADAGQYGRARDSVRSLLDRDSLDQEKSAQHLSQQDQAALHHLLAAVEEKLDDPVEAVRQYQLAADLDPSEANIFDWGAEMLMHHAPEPAVAVFAKGNRVFPHSVRMLTGLGVAWYERGSYDQAAMRLCQAADLDPKDPNPYLFLGKMLTAETVQPEGMAQRLERFARLQPENAQANYYYALSLWKQRKDPEDRKNLAQVESLLQKAVRLDPNLAAAHLQLGIVYAERNDFSQAITAYQKAAEADPGLAEPHYRLAQAYKRTGENRKAQQELQLYQQISSQNVAEIERQRHELRQFVYTLQRGSSSPQ
jgi:tetratricopeptide (TPR) repeat protein